MAQNDKLDKILLALEQINLRVAKVEDVLTQQQVFINQIGKSALEKYIERTNVEEACGVDPSQIRRNQLMGEIPKLQKGDSEELSQKLIREERQALGAKLYAVYCWFFVVLMTLSFFDLLPVFSFETAFGKRELTQSSVFMGQTLYIPFILSFLYVVSIFSIQSFMADRQRFNLRYPLALWSLLIGLFSLFGSLRTVPALFNILTNRSFSFAVCGDTRNIWLFNKPSGFWTGLFVLSKVPELIDTLFIVLRKNKLITLHWYHHITVMLFCWHSWATHCLSGLFFSSMNLTVHAFMYFFYFLAALGFRPTAFAMYVTIIQIAQMFFGTAIAVYTLFHQAFIVPEPNLFTFETLFDLSWNIDSESDFDNSTHCKVNPGNAIYGFVMYASYLWLFCVFFYYAYLKPVNKRVPKDMAKPIGQEKKEN